MIEKALKIRYKNWKNEISIRRILPRLVYYGSSRWHKEPQWIMEAYDLDKGEMRSFAMHDILEIMEQNMFILKLLGAVNEKIRIDGHEYITSSEGVVKVPLNIGSYTVVVQGKVIPFTVKDEGETVTLDWRS